jgi:hypothetical protein
MVESIMYFGIGFLFAALIGVAIIPLIHGRAVQLTIRRLEASIPQSRAEIQADKDLLRAEFALSTRRLEMSVEQLMNKTTNQLSELGKKGDAINRLKIERDAQNVELIALKTRIEALNERLTAAGNEVKAESDVVSLVPKESPTSEQEARSGGPARGPDAGRDSSVQRIGLAREGSDISARLQAVESSTLVSPHPSDFENDQFARDRPSIIRTSSSLTRFFIAALISVGAVFAWQYHGDEAREMVTTWVSSLGSLLSVSKMKSPLDVTAKQTGSTPAGQVPARDAALPQPAPVTETALPAAAPTSPEHSVARPAAKQEQMSDTIATLQAVEQDIKQKSSPPPLQNGAKLTPTPETRPTAIEGWTLREITNGTAVLEGPNGIWRARPGDTVPGLGIIESYIRSNGRWIVPTSRGLILMP